jgi:hypothetical protein
MSTRSQIVVAAILVALIALAIFMIVRSLDHSDARIIAPGASNDPAVQNA